MRNLTEQNVTDVVLRQLDNTTDPRLRQVVASLVRHLHAFVRDVEPTEAEWLRATEFFNAVGQAREAILLSDTLGVSILVDAINHRKPAGATESTILGPFYTEGAPLRQPPVNLDLTGQGDPLIFSGRVTAPDGTPIEGALVDVWETAANGMYEGQDRAQPEFNLRGRMLTDGHGRFEFVGVLPRSYQIPTGGPVGRMLRALGRHPWRPAHVHFKVSAEGFEPLTTQVFVEGDPYLDSDAVFSVKSSLVARFERIEAADEAQERGVRAPFYVARYDFGLAPAA
jgi:catechol 1,2-dioxygenase